MHYLLQLARENDLERLDADVGTRLDRLKAEEANLRTGIEWALDHDPESALTVLAELDFYWLLANRQRVGRDLLERAIRTGASANRRERARVLQQAAWLTTWVGEHAQAEPLAEAARVLAAQLGDAQTLAHVQMCQADLAGARGDIDQARAEFDAGSGPVRIPRRSVGHGALFDLIREYRTRLGRCHGGSNLLRAHRRHRRRPGPPDGSIGLPLPGVLVRLIDRLGVDALVGDPGEVWVKGPNVFAGYWDDPEATRAALTEDGWLRTGDLAVVDDDGFLWLVDRAKDLIIVSGFNVVPAEVEAVLMGHPGVAEAAVVSVPDPRSGEAVKAFIVPVAGADIDEAAIVDHATRHLARYKCPSIITFVDELPHGLTGKLLRRQLR